MRSTGPWKVLAISPYDVVTIERTSQTTGRHYRDYMFIKYLSKVVYSPEER